MTRTILAMLLATIVVLPVLSLGAAAQTEALDREWREEARKLSFETLSDGFRGESVRESEIGDDELVARFFLDEGRLRVRYVSTEPGNESVLTMDLGFLGLVEFRDTDADGRYGFGDRSVQRITIGDMEGASVVSESFLTNGHAATVSYSFPNRSSSEASNDTVPPISDDEPSLLPGTLLLRFYMVPTTQTFGGSTVTPMDIKFDIEMTDFPYREAGTKLALETRFSASESVRDAPWRDRALEIGDGYFRGFLGWTRTAMVDSNPRPVEVSTLSHVPGADEDRGSSVAMAFTYPAGDKIVHDPQVGIVRYQGDLGEALRDLVEGNWLLYTLGLVVTLAAVGVPAVIRLRQ